MDHNVFKTSKIILHNQTLSPELEIRSCKWVLQDTASFPKIPHWGHLVSHVDQGLHFSMTHTLGPQKKKGRALQPFSGHLSDTEATGFHPAPRWPERASGRPNSKDTAYDFSSSTAKTTPNPVLTQNLTNSIFRLIGFAKIRPPHAFSLEICCWSCLDAGWGS